MRAATELPEQLLSSQTIAESIGDFVANFDFHTIPDQVIEYAKLCIVDTIGIGFASHRYEFAAKSIEAVRALAGKGIHPVVGTQYKAPPRDAALLNGILMHGLDFDDTHVSTVVHCSTSAVPLIMSEATRHETSGARALAAYLLAIETDARIGARANGMFQKIGFHPTGLVGVFGCTVAASYLARLNKQQIARAQGIALSAASGSLECLQDGSWTKRMHPGWAASSAITAAALAAGDFIGPVTAYEGRYGLYSLYLRDPDVDLTGLTADLGATWEMLKVAIKPYPVCHFNHACIDSMLALRVKHQIEPEDIKRITALIHEKQQDVVCVPEAAKRKPQSDYEAKFSLHFCVAAAAARGRVTLAELEDSALNDPEILSLCQRISYRHNPDSRYPRFYSGGLIVETNNGRTLTHLEPINRGADSRALGADDVREKFDSNVEQRLSPRQATRVWNAVMRLDRARDLSELNTSIAAV